MTKEKHLEVILCLQWYFKGMGIRKIDYPHDDILNTDQHGLEHCYGMLDRMKEFIREDRMDKVNRWLGFIQGVMWGAHKVTLTELMDLNRPVPPPE